MHCIVIFIAQKQQKWFTADNMKTALLNSDGEEVAVTERLKYTVSTHASRNRESFSENSNGNNSTVGVRRLF